MNDGTNAITSITPSQQFSELTMIERGLYATFAMQESALRNHASYYPEHGIVSVLNALNALANDGIIKAVEGSKPTQYESAKSKKRQDSIMRACLDAYNDVRDPAWTAHRTITRTLRKSLSAFIQQAGDDAPNVMRRGLEAQKKEWAAGKKLDLVNLLTNDKVIRFAEREEPQETEGMVYRLSVGKPDVRLPDSSSYAMRIDARRNGSVEGFVFPEGNPASGVLTKVPAKALSTPLVRWDAYQEQHA